MPLAKSSPAPSWFITFATFILVVAVLRFAEDVMIPVALSLLLAFLLSPLVVRLRRWRLPRTLAIATTVTLAFLVIGTATWLITNQAIALLEELPRYEENLQKKVAALKKPQASDSLSSAFLTLNRMWSDLRAPAPVAAPAMSTKPAEVRPGDATSFELGREALARLARPLSTAGIVIVFVIVILFQRDDLRSRFIRVVSGGQLNIATEAVDDAAQRVSRYLLAQLMVNTCFGLCVGLGLFVIGIPHAALWGLLSTLLRFIPYLGPMIAVTFPAVLAIAVDPGWAMLGWTIVLFVAAELITSNVIEVWVYGTKTGISVLALITAAVFWSWLWGLPGLFLSTPLTVCLLVLGQYVPGLKFLSVLLGSEPALDPAAQFYQRMLSMDQEAMFTAAETFIAQRSLAEFYDDVFVPALLMSEVDRHNGVLAEVRQKFILESSRELIEELGLQAGARRPSAEPPRLTPPAPSSGATPVMLGIPARDEADELVALMFSQLLLEQGLVAEVVAATAAPETYREQLRTGAVTVFVSALPPSTLSGAGRACRRVKQLNPSAKVMIGVWRAEETMENLKRRLDPTGADAIAVRLSAAVVQWKNLVAASPAARQPAVETEATRTLERTETKLAATKPDEATDMVMRQLARAFAVPIALVSVIETDRDFWKSSGSRLTDTPFVENSVHAGVLMTDDLLVVEDVAKEERFAAHPLLVKRGVRAFASAPLRSRSGHLVGHLCVLDTQPRTFSAADKELLQSLAAQLMEAVSSKAPSDPAAAVL